MLGNYRGNPPQFTTVCEGVVAHAVVSSCINGSAIINRTFGKPPHLQHQLQYNVSAEVDIAEAVAAVKDADAVVLVVGTFARWKDNGWNGEEGEGIDRQDLLMPIYQSSLIAAVSAAAAAQSKPVVLVVMSGGPVDLSAAKSSAHTPAIIWAGFPGEHGGAAIADAIFATVGATGEEASRFGKLSQTWYSAGFVRECDMTDFRMRPGPAYCPTSDNCFNETLGRGNRLCAQPPLSICLLCARCLALAERPLSTAIRVLPIGTLVMAYPTHRGARPCASMWRVVPRSRCSSTRCSARLPPENRQGRTRRQWSLPHDSMWRTSATETAITLHCCSPDRRTLVWTGADAGAPRRGRRWRSNERFSCMYVLYLEQSTIKMCRRRRESFGDSSSPLDKPEGWFDCSMFLCFDVPEK